MCFRPPEAGAGEVVCPSCFIVAEPLPDGTCPECGAAMRKDVPAAGAPTAPAAPGGGSPGDAPKAPGAPKPPGA